MQAEIPFLRLTGDGSVDVLAQELDYRFKANVFETPTFADGESYDDLTGLTIPVTISGAADDPKIGVDIAALATNVAVQKATDKLFDRLGLGKKEPAPEAGEGGDTSQQAVPDAEQQEQEPEDARDALRRGLGDLLKR
jgi:AsmA protein